jgi:phage baseplate assembly protein W
MARSNAIEDGNLNQRPINVTVERLNSDVDCTFLKRPSGDVYKKTDAYSVAQSVKNILMTNRGEKPFNPEFGGNLGSLLFELGHALDQDNVFNMVENALNAEPRAKVREVKTVFAPDYNSLTLTVTFSVTATMEIVSISVNISRIR